MRLCIAIAVPRASLGRRSGLGHQMAPRKEENNMDKEEDRRWQEFFTTEREKRVSVLQREPWWES